MKRIVSLVLAMVMVLSFATTALAATEKDPFVDVSDKNMWYYDAINRAYKDGIINGAYYDPATGIRKFLPANTLTNSEFIAIMTRAFYSSALQNAKVEKDYSKAKSITASWAADSWYANNYYVAQKNELLSGDMANAVKKFNDCATKYQHEISSIGSNLLNARESAQNAAADANKVAQSAISRYDMAFMIAKIAKDNGLKATPAQITTAKKSIGDYSTIHRSYAMYEDAVATVFALGIITGVNANGDFSGSTSVTRAQAAVIYCRLSDAIKATKG